MRIETERLAIRSLEREDAAQFIDMASDGSLSEIFGDCTNCAEWMGDWIADSLRLEAENNPHRDYIAFAIAEREGGQAIGSIGTTYYEDMGRVGITYFLGAKYRGHGYMTEAVKAFAQYVFANYDVDSLFAVAALRNPASCRTLSNAGFALIDTRMYQDMYDDECEMQNFYELRRA